MTPSSLGYAAPACVQHADSPVAGVCGRCGRSVCELCTFWIGSATYCPECIAAGPSDEERAAVFSRGILSVVLAVLGALVLVGTMVAGAGGDVHIEGFGAAVLGIAMMLCTLGGLALALIAREGSRRTGSILPGIGVIANGVLVLVQLGLAVLGAVHKG